MTFSYSWAIFDLILVAINIPFALKGNTLNTLAIGFCSAMAMVNVIGSSLK